MKLLIAGDTVPTPSNYSLFQSADMNALVGKEIMSMIAQSDFFILNLEAPLVDKDKPITKCGPNLRAPTSAVKALQAMKPGLISLANNHIMDHREQGLLSTLDILNQVKIPYTGVGNNLKEAATPHIVDVEGHLIGIYSCAEHEFSIATENAPGANPFDPLYSLDHIADLKKLCDYVIVLYHGGKEHYRYPSPNLQKTCRRMVDKGADVIVCQHSHCIGCKEEYRDATIVYGQGNFIFDHSESEFWQTSLVIDVHFRKDDGISITYHPIVKDKCVVRLADEDEAANILDGFISRSEEIKLTGFIAKKYKEYAYQMLPTYLLAFSGSGRSLFTRAVNKLSGGKYLEFVMKRKYSRDQRLVIRNFVECEAHNELCITGLN